MKTDMLNKIINNYIINKCIIYALIISNANANPNAIKPIMQIFLIANGPGYH